MKHTIQTIIDSNLQLSIPSMSHIYLTQKFPPEAATVLVANSLFWGVVVMVSATKMGAADIPPNAGMGILDTVNGAWIRLAGAAVGHSVMVMVAAGLGAVETQADAVTVTSVVGGVPRY